MTTSTHMLDSLQKRYPSSLPLTFLILAVLVPFWKLTTMRGFVITDDIFTSDIMNIGFPFRHYIGTALKAGQLPIWLPHIYGGYPLLAGAGVCYPTNLLLFGLLPSYVALNVSILLTLIIAAIGTYFYARGIRISIGGSVLAALAFAYSGFMIAHLKHDGLVASVCLLPIGLYCIERALNEEDRRRQIVPLMWLSFVFGCQNLSGHVQTSYYAGLFYGSYFLVRMLHLRRGIQKSAERNKHSVGKLPKTGLDLIVPAWFVVAMILGVGISSIQLLPTYELVSLSQRSGGTAFDFAANYAYDPKNIVTFIFPYANGDIGNGTYRGNSIFWEDYGYVGLVTLLLACYGSFRRWRKRPAGFFAITAVVSYLLVLGPNTPVYEMVFRIVPGMNYFRFPTRFLFLVDFSLAILAGLGLDALFASRREEQKAKAAAVISSKGELVLIGIVFADLLYFQMRQNPIVDASTWSTPPRSAEVLAADKGLFRIFSPGASEAHKAAFAAARGWQGSLQPYIDQREFLQVSSNVAYGISSADGYAGLAPNHVVDIWGDQNRAGLIIKTASVTQEGFVPQPAFMKILSLFNIKYVLSAWPIKSSSLEPFQTIGQVFFYRNPAVMPRAFMVPGYKFAQNPDAAKAILLSDEFDPRREAIIYRQLSLSSSPSLLNATVAIEQYRANEVVVRVKTDREGILIFSDTYYPGWKVFVDGSERELLQANVCQRAVEVSAGDHEVRFVFDSPTVNAGLGMSILSMLLAGGLLFVGRRRR